MDQNYTMSGTSTSIPINKYGRCVRVRWNIHGAAGISQTYEIIITKAASIALVDPATTLFRIDKTTAGTDDNWYGWQDVNFNVEKTDRIMIEFSETAVCTVWLDIIPTRESRDKQFHDQLGGFTNE